ncbi:MAG: hypothetical protein FJ088_15540 [Deltaproteobacteria bacterium]|nr:hypothetical protein [Deltaproteobacteria bacterium]
MNLKVGKVFSFDLRCGASRRTQFYRELFGYTNRVVRPTKRDPERTYTFFKPGLLRRIPHIKLGSPVFAVPLAAAEEVGGFFKDPKWNPIELHVFDAVLPSDAREQSMENALDAPVLIARGQYSTLREEVKLLKHDNVEPDRVSRTTRAVEYLLRMDWTDGKKFSKKLKAQACKL